MSLISYMHRLFGGPSDEEKASVRREWRETVHDNRNSAARAIATAHKLQKVSRTASGTLDRLKRSGDALLELTNDTLDRTRR
jgi:hypothetical protein